ncbi:MAG: acyl-CoA dehydratase activase-related protein [Candidatus Gastranaerophilales bacterium]|nr:acyl-CoA dehydratase activase-related protein [Candidatus Gastranaerophilales bacterium]
MQQNICKISKIGIPRAMSYYHNYPFYHGFFKELGIEIVLSDKTTSKLINEGTKHVVSETCLPIKVFVGHVINLLDKGITNIFIPSIQSIDYKINNCSKIRGLPEIIRNVIDRPFNMIEPTLDKTEKIGFYDFWNYTANAVGVTDKKLIKKAIDAGWEKYDNFLEMTKLGISYQTALENALNGVFENRHLQSVKPLSVVIMAHGYNLFDERISLNLIKKLEKMNVKVYTALNVSKENSIKSIHELGELMYWANEADLTGAAAYYLLNNKVDGIIAISAFGCGPDSLMVDEISYHAKKANMPMMNLTIDEHTGEAGFVTRLDAFIDMLVRKKRKETLIKTKINSISENEQKTEEKRLGFSNLH